MLLPRYVLTLAVLLPLALSAEEAGPSANETRQAKRMLRQAEEHLALEEADAAMALYEKVIDRFDGQALGFTAHLALGRLHVAAGRHGAAIERFARASQHGVGPKAVPNPDLAERSEALFLLGMALVQDGKSERCFGPFREVITVAPGSDWANQAYFQIAEAHYRAGNFSQAMANYRLVGTSLDQTQATSGLFEIGKPLSLRLEDRDLLVHEGSAIQASLVTSDGDRETLTLQALRPGGDIYVNEMPTALGAPRPGDGVIQGSGNTTITITFRDHHTGDGQLDVERSQTLRAVATGSAAFTDGAFQDPLSAVVLDEGTGLLHLRVVDFDRDSGTAVDRLAIDLVVERPLPMEEGSQEQSHDLDEEERWEERGRRSLDLEETVLERRTTINLSQPGEGGGFATAAADAGRRSGIFTGTCAIAAVGADGDVLAVAIGDRIRLRYRDERHLRGNEAVLREAVVTVAPGTVSRLMMAGYHLDDANLKVRKELLQAETGLRIGEVYRDMGLDVHAQRRFASALEECRRVGATEGVFDRELHEHTLYTLWRIYLAMGDLTQAAKACHTLQREFPASDFIDDSLMDLGRAAALAGETAQAIQLFRQVVALPVGSPLAAEALFEIANINAAAIDVVGRDGVATIDSAALQRAVQAYREVFTVFPDSAFAGEALRKTGDLYFKERNYVQAIDFFERILRDHGDAPYIADVLFSLARSYVLKGDHAACGTMLDRLMREHPGYERMDTVRKLRAYLARQTDRTSP